MVMVLAVLLIACKDKFLATSYKTLQTAQIAYDTGMGAIAQGYEDGTISESQKDEAIRVGMIFYDSWMLACGALEAYAEIGDVESKKDVTDAILVMIGHYDEFKGLVMNLLKHMKMPEVANGIDNRNDTLGSRDGRKVRLASGHLGDLCVV